MVGAIVAESALAATSLRATRVLKDVKKRRCPLWEASAAFRTIIEFAELESDDASDIDRFHLGRLTSAAQKLASSLDDLGPVRRRDVAFFAHTAARVLRSVGTPADASTLVGIVAASRVCPPDGSWEQALIDVNQTLDTLLESSTSDALAKSFEMFAGSVTEFCAAYRSTLTNGWLLNDICALVAKDVMTVELLNPSEYRRLPLQTFKVGTNMLKNAIGEELFDQKIHNTHQLNAELKYIPGQRKSGRTGKTTKDSSTAGHSLAEPSEVAQCS